MMDAVTVTESRPGLSSSQLRWLIAGLCLGISLVAAASGYVVSRTGRYKWTMLSGAAPAAVALALLIRIGPNTTALGLAPVSV